MSEDYFLPRLLAQWNPTRGVWETGQMDLLSGQSELYSETFPSSGMTRNGVVYELPTPALPTDASGYSLLPTALASDGDKGGPNQRGASGDLRLSSAVQTFPTPRATRGGSGTETMYRLGAERVDSGRTQGQVLLKTPTSQLAVNGGSQHPDKRKSGGHGPTLADEVEHLLPTPAAMNPNDGEGLTTWEARRQRVKLTAKNGNGFGTPLAIAVQQIGEPTGPQSAAGNTP